LTIRPAGSSGQTGNKVTEYFDSGTIHATEFTGGELAGPTGVIPVPPDWKTTMLFDYLNYTAEDLSADTDPALWELLEEPVEELRQMLYATPLTEDQMEDLLRLMP